MFFEQTCRRYSPGLAAIVCLLGLLILSAADHAFSAERLSVSAPLANIRSGPATTHDVLWQIEKFHPIQILKTSGDWFFFRDFEGDEGWIHSSLVQKIPSLITAQNECNIRSGPGTSFPVLFTVGKGIPFKILEQKGSWFHIQHADGDKGWIHKSLVW
jgi:SH3-like domain-containing protein